MTDFSTVKKYLERIIALGYKILPALEEDEFEAEQIKELMDQRGRQVQALNKTEINKNELSKGQKEQLRNVFTRLYILEKRINKNLAKLSLNYNSMISDIDLHKKAQNSYAGAARAGQFFDTQISG